MGNRTTMLVMMMHKLEINDKNKNYWVDDDRGDDASLVGGSLSFKT